MPPLPSDQTSGGGRYLFQLATVTLAYRQKVNLVGMSQTLQIGYDTTSVDGEPNPPVYPVTKIVGRSGAGNPLWTFPDANVSWHVRMVRQVPQVLRTSFSVLTTDSFAYQWSYSPALIFQSATFDEADTGGDGTPGDYTTLTDYSPPRVPGEPVSFLGTFTDLRFQSDDYSSSTILDPITLEGPGCVCLFASVWQTDPASRATLVVPTMFPIDPEMPEEGFVAAWPNANYWRVGGSLVIER